MTPVHGTIRRPYESICRSVVNRRIAFVFGTNYTSSGVLLGKNMLLTAAHNYASPRAPWAVVRDRNIQCGTGTVRSSAPWWTITDGFDRQSQVRTPPGFAYHDFGRDYALVGLGKKAPSESSFRLPRPDEDSLLARGSVVFIAGFPAEGRNSGSILFHGRARIRTIDAFGFEYELETERGLSGSPVWIERNGEFIIVGIHVRNGGAVRLTNVALKYLEEWQNEFQSVRPEL